MCEKSEHISTEKKTENNKAANHFLVVCNNLRGNIILNEIYDPFSSSKQFMRMWTTPEPKVRTIKIKFMIHFSLHPLFPSSFHVLVPSHCRKIYYIFFQFFVKVLLRKDFPFYLFQQIYLSTFNYYWHFSFFSQLTMSCCVCQTTNFKISIFFVVHKFDLALASFYIYWVLLVWV